MHSCRFFASAAILVFVCGCATSRVTDEYYAQADPGVIVPSHVAVQGDIPLGPGDVLYLHRGSSGSEEPGSLTEPSGAGTTTSPERIPLRRIGPQAACGATGAGGRLYDYERALLESVLATNRNPESTEQTEEESLRSSLGSAIRQNEIALWNCLVENLTIRRIADANEGAASGALQLRVNMDSLLAPLPADAPVRAYYRTGMQDFPPIDAHDDPATDTVNEVQARQNDAIHAADEGITSFSLVTVGLNEVAIQRPQWPEQQWTLLEWDQAGVLTDRNKNESRLLVLRFSRGGDRFYVAECFGLDPTHHVEVAFRDERPTRELVRTHSGLQGWFKILHQGAALAQSNLNDLVVADVRSFEVGSGARCGVR